MYVKILKYTAWEVLYYSKLEENVCFNEKPLWNLLHQCLLQLKCFVFFKTILRLTHFLFPILLSYLIRFVLFVHFFIFLFVRLLYFCFCCFSRFIHFLLFTFFPFFLFFFLLFFSLFTFFWEWSYSTFSPSFLSPFFCKDTPLCKAGCQKLIPLRFGHHSLHFLQTGLSFLMVLLFTEGTVLYISCLNKCFLNMPISHRMYHALFQNIRWNSSCFWLL